MDFFQYKAVCSEWDDFVAHGRAERSWHGFFTFSHLVNAICEDPDSDACKYRQQILAEIPASSSGVCYGDVRAELELAY